MNDTAAKVFGYGCLGLALLCAGHDVWQTNKINGALTKLGLSLDGITERTQVEIDNAVVRKAVADAAETEATRVVKYVSDDVKRQIASDMHAEVSAAVDQAYISVKDAVKESLEKEVGRIGTIGTGKIKREIIEEAKRELKNKLERELDRFLDDAKGDIDDKVDELKDTAQEKIDELVDETEKKLDDLFDKQDREVQTSLRIHSSIARSVEGMR